MIVKAEKVDPDAITVSHIFLANERTGKVSYDDIIEDIETKQSNYYYATCELIMGKV